MFEIFYNKLMGETPNSQKEKLAQFYIHSQVMDLAGYLLVRGLVLAQLAMAMGAGSHLRQKAALPRGCMQG